MVQVTTAIELQCSMQPVNKKLSESKNAARLRESFMDDGTLHETGMDLGPSEMMMSPNDRGDIILGNSISQLLFDHIEVVDIGLMVLAVVDLHYLGGDHLNIGIIISGASALQGIQ